MLVDFSDSAPALVQTFFCPYDDQLRTQLLSLHRPDYDELNRAAILSNQLSCLYAEATTGLLKSLVSYLNRLSPLDAMARRSGIVLKQKGTTIQLVNAALLAELTQITVVSISEVAT